MSSPPTTRSRLRGLFEKVALVGFSLVLVGGATELFARWFQPHWAPRTAVLTRLWQHDPVLGWSHVPGAEGEFAAFGFDTRVTINSQGFRDRERDYDRADDVFRMVVLGDSMVWGYGVEDDEVFTRILERRVPGLEAINLGVSGYGTDQELLLLRNEGLRYEADLYALVLVENDFVTNQLSRVFMTYEKPFFVFDDDGKLESRNTPVPRLPGIVRRAILMTRASYVLNRAAQALNELETPPEPWPPPADNQVWDEPFPRLFAERITVALIREIQREVEAAGATFVLVLKDGLGPIRDDVVEYFSGSVPLVDLGPAFAGYPNAELHVDGSHWNAAGHEKVAERLIEYLNAGGFLGGAPAGGDR